jgi:hypothetical protein
LALAVPVAVRVELEVLAALLRVHYIFVPISH